MTKYIFITGGVVSSLGKGIAAASIGRLLESRGLKIPLRKKPASNRTNNLPSFSSLKELLNFLLTNFGEKNKWEFWVTPEELCDIVE